MTMTYIESHLFRYLRKEKLKPNFVTSYHERNVATYERRKLKPPKNVWQTLSQSAEAVEASVYFMLSKYLHNMDKRYFPIPPFIPELERLSLRELENLNKNQDILNQFVDELPQASSLSQDVDNLLESIDQLSNNVKDKKTLLATQRQRLLENYETLNTLKQQWDSLCAQHHSLSQRYLPANLETSLRQAAAQAEEESEDLAEVFLSGQMDHEKFIGSYTASRTLSHSRKTKEEIFNKQLQELQRLGY